MVKYNRQTPCVYRNKKIVFHGIPKNASTSVKNFLYEEEWGKPFESINKQFIHKGTKRGGSIYPDISVIESKKYASYTHFTVVRNPYDRFISFYSDLFLKTTDLRNNTPPFFKDNKIKLTQKPVNEVIDMVCSFSDEEADEHFASQVSFVYKNPIYYLKMESLNEDWEQFCIKLNIAYNPLPVYNKSDGKVYLTEDQKDKIYNRYKEDFERFKYER